MIGKILFTILALSLFVSLAYADESDEATSLFHQGNAFYSEEKYDEAIRVYEEALRTGFTSAALYYNLGNAYFKEGSLGKSVLNYERAKELTPNDADLNANLVFAKSLVKGLTEGKPRRWLVRIVFDAANAFSLDRITVASSILFSLFSIAVISLILFTELKNKSVYIVGIPAILLAISLLFFTIRINETVLRERAVVTVDNTDAKFEPIQNATTHFTLYEGESIAMIAVKDNWIKVRRLDGKQGWIKKESIEFI